MARSTRHRPALRSNIHLLKRSLALAWLVLGTGGCTLLLPEKSSQCSVDADCTAKDGNLVCTDGVCSASKAALSDPAWGCLEGSEVVEDRNQPVNLQTRYFDPSTNLFVPNVKAVACDLYNLDCQIDSPSVVAGPVISAADGSLGMPLFQGFSGFYVNQSEGYLPILGMEYGLDEVNARTPNTPMISPALASTLIGAAGVTWNQQNGIALVITNDCTKVEAGGVQILVDRMSADTKIVYLADNLPVAGLTATAAGKASGLKGGISGGTALLINVPSGSVALTWRLQASGRVLATRAALFRPGTITYAGLRPAGALIRE